MPAQIIIGGNDLLIRSHETRLRAERMLPRLRLTYLDGVGHILPRQTDAILDFLHSTVAGC